MSPVPPVVPARAQESPSIESLRPNHAFSHFLEAQNIGMREQIRKNIEKMLSSSIFGILGSHNETYPKS